MIGLQGGRKLLGEDDRGFRLFSGGELVNDQNLDEDEDVGNTGRRSHRKARAAEADDVDDADLDGIDSDDDELQQDHSGDEDDEEGEGDLGFGAARDQEGSRRKVIVERLEMVKSKPPVFTWC